MTIDSAKNYFGSTSISFKKRVDDSLEPLTDFTVVCISNAYNLTEKSYEEVLLQEMIHIYQGVLLEMWPEHDNIFEQKVKEINQKSDYEIPTYEEPKNYFKERREISWEERKARNLLFQEPRIVDEWEENGEHIIKVVVT